MTMQERVQKSFCTTREAAQILGVSLRTAQLWTESGLLEGWKTEGGHRRITRQSVERLLANPSVSSGREAERSDAEIDVGDPSLKERLSILVVEDEPDLRRVYEIVLSRWSMKPKVVTVSDGYEALIRIGIERPDLVISDLRMPGINGFKMIRSLRAVEELAWMTIVVVTGLDPNEIDDHGGLPEGIAVLPKPVPFDALQEIATPIVPRMSGLQHLPRKPS